MGDVDLAAVAALIGESSRAAMLDALMSGRALAAGELARVAGIGGPAASAVAWSRWSPRDATGTTG
jgi:hypothetical protein